MRIIFVRHGNPNYQLDVLTELGHEQARAAAERLCHEGIEAIYSSTCGRAMQTAEYTAKKIGLDIIPCDFIREIHWGSRDGEPILENGSPWYYTRQYLNEGRCLNDTNWREDPLFSKSRIIESSDAVARGVDEWLCTLGFEREGYFYRVREPKHDTVAMFCHAGAFGVALAHILNLPVPFVLFAIPFPQTGIFELQLSGKQSELITPSLFKDNAIRHLKESGIEIT